MTSGGHIHRTAAAIERVNKLWCYSCDTMDHGKACVDVALRNKTTLMKKCKGEEFFCMVSSLAQLTHSRITLITLAGQTLLLHHKHGELDQLAQDVVTGSSLHSQL